MYLPWKVFLQTCILNILIVTCKLKINLNASYILLIVWDGKNLKANKVDCFNYVNVKFCANDVNYGLPYCNLLYIYLRFRLYILLDLLLYFCNFCNLSNMWLWSTVRHIVSKKPCHVEISLFVDVQCKLMSCWNIIVCWRAM